MSFVHRLSSVRVRITLAATLVFAIALSVASWALVGTVQRAVRDRVRDQNEEAIAEYKQQIQSGFTPGELPMRHRPAVDLQILDENGRVVGGSPGYAAGSPIWRPSRHVEISGPYVTDSGDQLLLIEEVAAPAGIYTVVAASPLDQVQRSVDALSGTLWVLVPMLIVLVGGVAWIVTGRALRPVEAIRAQVEVITGSSLDRRVPEPPTRDEVSRLAHTMNEMLDRLQDAALRQRRFVSDASHELRSPIASIRATGEVALTHPEQADWPEVVETMLGEDARLEEIVAQLLALARDDEMAAAAPSSEVDLDDIVLEEAARARRGNVEIRTEQVSAGRVDGSREQLTRVVRNLLDNATRHAQSVVAVSLRTDDGTVELTVDDDGPGIQEQDRERVFERFTRLDDARARDAGGLGLGLAMARAIVERHHGALEAGSSEALHGASLIAQFPAA